jgi:hypothetical protein
VIVFLVSARANYVTGTMIPVDEEASPGRQSISDRAPHRRPRTFCDRREPSDVLPLASRVQRSADQTGRTVAESRGVGSLASRGF